MAEINKTLMDKINQGRQYRLMQMCVRKAEDDAESYIVEGYATTFNEPYLMYEGENYRFLEKVDKEAFKECDMADVIFQYDHEGRVFARISNNTLTLEIDNHGLKVTADLSGTEEGRKLYQEIKGGYTNKMSFGFTVADDKTESYTDEKDNKRVYVRTITKFSKLFDVSAVSIPANSGTEISSRSYCEGVIAELEKKRTEEENEKQKTKIETEKRERARLRALSL